ncbi:ROK family protein [Paludicola sp. MB14-C6]|uniref:ROK family protein n=1 Tax=Paludihabitans sp. MB14-C6 TaxID=3070656 RepID=UPI0027DCE4CF|nr:ROK family protein [Paludicola sp. MB14-C6]WMJ23897.1 ROK family protein [Paludicola sp. MB14-C6]
MKEYIIALDVGGSSIKSALIEQNPQSKELTLIEDSYRMYDSKSKQSKDEIVENLIAIFKKQIDQLKGTDFSIKSLAIAFPGPFDYEKGISLMQSLDKFDDLYQVNVTEEIRKKLIALNDSKLSADIPIVYENDATAFALGEYVNGEAKGFHKAAFITLGTGCGSSFIEDGNLVKGKKGIPVSGMIFDAPFQDSIIDDYISKRNILAIAKSHGFDIQQVDVKQLQQLAEQSNQQAKDVFIQFGALLGSALGKYFFTFEPQVLVLGGRISNAFSLMKDSFYQAIFPLKPKVALSKDLSKSALIGIAAYSQRFI